MYAYLFKKYAKIMEEILVSTEFIKLDSFLKFSGVVSLGSEAKMYILDELVSVNGEVCTQRGKKLYKGDVVEFNGEEYKVV